tara:strand:+ start:103 stop:384 length:282 start_codon:yes stop_codon:yes gene_type:complete
MDGAGKKLLIFMESAQQQLGGGVWLDMRAQMRSLDQSTNNNHVHTNSSQEKDHLHSMQRVISFLIGCNNKLSCRMLFRFSGTNGGIATKTLKA